MVKMHYLVTTFSFC